MSQEDAYQRVRRFLPPLVNLELLVLKGHLMVEEQLQLFLETLSHHPSSLKAARLSFIQKANLVHALSGIRNGPEWRFIVHLNTLRNGLVHRLEPGDVAALVDNLLRSYWQKEFRTPLSNRQRASRLRQTLAFIIGMLSGYVEGFAAVQRLGKPPDLEARPDCGTES